MIPVSYVASFEQLCPPWGEFSTFPYQTKTRTRKPQGFYVSEFLTPSKLKLFHNLRNLKKQYPQKIKSVFTRSGSILYTLHSSNRVFQVNTIEDLRNIVGLEDGRNNIVVPEGDRNAVGPEPEPVEDSTTVNQDG